MRCDFQNVTDILLRNMGSSTAIYYNNLLNILFGSYLAETHLYEFDRPTAAKLHKGTIRVAPEMSEFYLNADRTILCRDIEEILQYIFDKPNTYNEYSRYTTYIKDDIVIYYEQYTKEMYDENVNTEDAEISTLIINGHEAIYFQDNNQYCNLIWDNGDYIISLGSNIGKNALIEIAESVQIVKE